MTETDNTSVQSDRFSITNKTFDHAVDAICALGIVGSIALGDASATTVGGLVTIALGKRAIK